MAAFQAGSLTKRQSTVIHEVYLRFKMQSTLVTLIVQDFNFPIWAVSTLILDSASTSF